MLFREMRSRESRLEVKLVYNFSRSQPLSALYIEFGPIEFGPNNPGQSLACG